MSAAENAKVASGSFSAWLWVLLVVLIAGLVFWLLAHVGGIDPLGFCSRISSGDCPKCPPPTTCPTCPTCPAPTKCPDCPKCDSPTPVTPPPPTPAPTPSSPSLPTCPAGQICSMPDRSILTSVDDNGFHYGQNALQNGDYALLMQKQGNIVMYKKDGTTGVFMGTGWSEVDTSKLGGVVGPFSLQIDPTSGDLSITGTLNGNKATVWKAGATPPHAGPFTLFLTADGKLQLFAGRDMYWHST